MSEPIRVLQVVTHMNRGGLETMLMNYYRSMDRTKVQFDFLVHRAYRADYDNEIESLGGRIFRLSRLVPWDYRYRKELDQFFLNHKEYKIVHVHQDCLSSVILKAAKKNHISVRIAHSHSSNQTKDIKYLIKLFYMQSIPKYATHLIACGKAAGDWMFRDKKYKVINNAINLTDYSYDVDKARRVRASLGIPNDALVIGHVGSFSPAKNHDFLIRLFHAVHERDEKAVLLLVGDGGLRKNIAEKVEHMNSAASVIFTGVRNDVPSLMQAMDMFVFPSVYEGLPLVMIEAQAAGLPCLISDQVPVECILTDEVRRMSLSTSIDDWANAVFSMQKLPRSSDSTRIIDAGFDITDNAKKLEKFYLYEWNKSQ